MAISTITYADKSDLNTTGTPDTNKITASNMNEIKSVVNTTANGVGDVSTLTTTATNVVDGVNENKSKLDYVYPTLLYSDVNGSANVITLDETVANFSFIEVYARSNGTNYFTQKIPTSTSQFVLSCSDDNTSGTHIWDKIVRYSLSGTTITPLKQAYKNVNSTDSGSSTTTFNLFYIYRVLGYK